MGVIALQLNHGLTHVASTGPWRKENLIFLQGIPEDGAYVETSGRAVTAICAERGVFSGEGGTAAQGLQGFLWQEFFLDPTQWFDNRSSKRKPGHPDFKHRKSNDALWLNNSFKPAWVDPQLAILDGGLRRPTRYVSTSVQGHHGSYEGHFEIGTCSKLCEDGQVTDAVDALSLLVQQGCHIPHNLFYRVLKRCIAQNDLVLGRRIHALTVESGYDGNSFLATQLIGLYASQGSLEEAVRVFRKVTPPSAYNWASIIFAYARHGEPTQAIGLYRQMCESTVKPDNRIFVAVLKACATAGDLAAGKDVHAHVCASDVKPDIFVQTCLVDMYAKCGSIKDAQEVFDGLTQKNVVTWNAMIAGYAQQGMGEEALRLYSSMHQEGMIRPSSVTFVCLLQACAGVGGAALYQGRQLHAEIEQLGVGADVVVGASLVNMYAKCGSLEDAQKVFDRLPRKNVFTWTAMIAGYAQQGMGKEALSLYSSMQQGGITPPDSVTFVCLLQACASVGVGALHQGKQIHVQIKERKLHADVVVGNTLVSMYAKCGNLEDALRVFNGLPQKNVVTWNAMITGYVQQGMGEEALSLYTSMQQEGVTPDYVTFVCLLQACSSVGVAALHQVRRLHSQIDKQGLQDDAAVANNLINMYAKCGRLEDARNVFNRLPHRDVVTWTAMIAGYAQQGMGQEALSLYSSMQQEGITLPGSVTFVCLLQACATVAALPLGKQLHAQIEGRGLQSDEVVGPSLVNMYAKCGSLEESQEVFDSLHKRDVVAWGALIAGYARRGDSNVVFDLVHMMRQDGIEPDGITLLSVLTVCSHAGLVDDGRKYFEAMSRDYGISPTIEHYTCMVDLLGRAGHLDEALVTVKSMPFQPDVAVWLTLLGTCQKWSNVEVGRQAFDCAVRLDDKDGAAYALMSNIYAGAQMWEEAQEMQTMKLKFGARKQPGQSWWTDMDGLVHSFLVGDRNHPATEGMHTGPEQLVRH